MDQLSRAVPELIEFQEVMAKLRRASYEAHIRAGFTKEQALELCKTVMPS